MHNFFKHHPGSLRLATALCFTLVGLNSVRAATISSNLSSTSAGTEAATGDTYLAGAFNTDSSTYTLNSITLLLSAASTGVSEVDLYSDGLLSPGSLITTLTSPSSYSSTLANTVYSSSGITLSADATYWVVLKSLSGEFDWSWTTDNTGTGAGYQSVWGTTDDAGTTWYSYDLYPLQFSVDATALSSASTDPSSATPEPRTLLLIFSGVLLLGCCIWQQKGNASNLVVS